MNTTQATKHSDDCNHSFGRRTPGCPRCSELSAGAAPRSWGSSVRRAADQARITAIRSHVCSVATCGPVCTAFDW